MLTELEKSAQAILLDIEGTVAPISFVHDVLFPYAREHMDGFLRQHWDEPAVAAARAMLELESGEFSPALLDRAKTTLFRLMDGDVKSTGLKQIQGMIWDEGYRQGAFVSPIYPDVAPAMKRWTQAGKIVAIYSSGSIAAQKVFFRHAADGDLTLRLSGFFDTTTGPKRSPASYTAIASQLKLSPAKILFISDVLEEVQAATAAGMAALIAKRPGNAPVADPAFPYCETFSNT